MAGKTTDTILRVRAQNLSRKDLRDVSTDLNAIADSQKKNATASGLASRALKELTDEQRQLAAIASELNRRGGIAGNLQKQKSTIDDLTRKLTGARAELDRLMNVKATGGFGTQNIDKQIKRVNADIKQTERQIQRTATQFQRTADAGKQVGINLKNSDQVLAQINSEAARTQALMTESAGAVDRYNSALAESKASLKAQETVQQEITAEAQRRNEIEARAAAQRRAEAAALSQQLAAQERRRADAVAAFSALPAAATSGALHGPAGDPTAVAAAAGAAREAGIRERLVNVIRRQEAAGKSIIVNNDRQTGSTKRLSSALNENTSSLDRNFKAGGLLADTGRKSLSVYQRLRGQLLGLAAAYIGLYQAANLVRQAVTVEQQRRRIDIQLQTANNGDTAQALRDQKFLREEANRLGVVYEDLAKNYANYKIAAKSVGASNRTVNKTFSEAAEIVTGLALSTEDAEGVFRAFVQILGKNRVQAEELRGQLGDRLPGAVAAFADSLVKAGKIKTFADLDSYLKKGKANVKDFFDFVDNYAQKTHVGVEQNSKTLFAQFNRLTNVWHDFLQDFAKAGTSSEVLNVVNKLIEKLSGHEGQEFAKELATAFAQVGKGIIFIIDHFDQFLFLIKAFIALQAAKAVFDIGANAVISAAKIFQMGRNVVTLAKETRAAALAGEALTGKMRLMKLLGGPVGVAIAAAAGAIYLMTKNSREANKELDGLVAHVRNLRGLQGKAAVEGINQNTAQIKDMGKEIDSLLKKRRELEAHQTLGPNGAPNYAQGIRDLVSAVTDSTDSISEIDERIAQLRAQQQLLVASSVTTSKRLQKQAREDVAYAKKLKEEQDKISEAPPTNPDPNGNKEEKRHDLAVRAANELLEIEKAVSEARIALADTTQEQIDADYLEHLNVISKEIEKKRNDLESLKHDAERAKAPRAAADAQAAIDKLPSLQKELETKAKIDAVTKSIELSESRVNEAIARRDAEIDLINTKVQLGLLSEGEGRQKVLDIQKKYKEEIQSTITALQAQLEALKASDPNLARILHVDELLAKLEVTKVQAGELQSNIELIGKNLGGQFASGAAEGIGTLIKGLAGGIEGVNGIGAAFQNAKDSFLSFVASFLSNIAQMILQAIILQAIMNAIRGTSGGYTAAVTQALTGHTGGVVGSDIGGNPIRSVSAAMFAGAQRFHEGGLPGLKTNEVPAILKKREEVLTEDDPRNVLNGGLAGKAAAPQVNIKQITVLDTQDLAGEIAKTSQFEKAVINYIGRNSTKIRQMLGG